MNQSTSPGNTEPSLQICAEHNVVSATDSASVHCPSLWDISVHTGSVLCLARSRVGRAGESERLESCSIGWLNLWFSRDVVQ